MKNEHLPSQRKKLILKRIVGGLHNLETTNKENLGNSEELTLKNETKTVELYKPYTYKQLCQLNKKKYMVHKVEKLKEHFDECLINLKEVIELYKECINRTEFWEEKSTYDFNFADWNTLKKANGKLTRYFNDILKIRQKVRRILDEN